MVCVGVFPSVRRITLDDSAHFQETSWEGRCVSGKPLDSGEGRTSRSIFIIHTLNYWIGLPWGWVEGRGLSHNDQIRRVWIKVVSFINARDVLFPSLTHQMLLVKLGA